MTDDTTLTPPESPEAREERGRRLAEALGTVTGRDASQATERTGPAGDSREGSSGRERGSGARPEGVTRWRKKPVEVGAVQWTGGNLGEVLELTAGDNFHPVDPEDRTDDPDITAEVYDKLHSTWVHVYDGQWIIKGIKGEFYPCAGDVFAETYEPADAGTLSFSALDADPAVIREAIRSAATEQFGGIIETAVELQLAGKLPELEAAVRASERQCLRGERDLILGDLGDLLEALGLGDCARPDSPHEVMRQCIDEAAKLRNGGRHLGSTVEHQARALYAAWIDAAQHRDLSGAVAGLEEQLDGFEGPAWDGAESGLQWLERTRPAPADGLRPEDQPLPVPNDGASMHDLVIGDLMDGHPGARTLAGVVADLRDRKLLGLRRYGSLLQAFNGRDALRDLHEELEDAAVYARQCLTEAQSGDEALRMLRTVYGSLLQALLAVRAVMDRQEPGSEP